MRKFNTMIVAATMLATPAMADQTVFTLSGNGMKNTRPITVSDDWEFQWNSSGNIFQVWADNLDKDESWGVPVVLANQQGSGSGSSYQTKGGTFTFTVNAMGTWTVRIVQVTADPEPSASQAAPIEPGGQPLPTPPAERPLYGGIDATRWMR